jgi:hypothetical protein
MIVLSLYSLSTDVLLLARGFSPRRRSCDPDFLPDSSPACPKLFQIADEDGQIHG